MEQLAGGDPATWKEAWRRLYPVAFASAHACLGSISLNDCEEVAVETLAALVQSEKLPSDDHLKRWVAVVARKKATDRFRKYFAAKRGSNNVESLDSLLESGIELTGLSQEQFFHEIGANELHDVLDTLVAGLRKEHRIVLRDHYLENLSYAEIATKRNIAVGSVGVYLQRGLEALKSAIARKPQLKQELLQFLGDAGLVRALLPVISATQIGGWFFEQFVRCQEESALGPRRPQPPPSDDEKLRQAKEHLPEVALLSARAEARLMDLARHRYPLQFDRSRKL